MNSIDILKANVLEIHYHLDNDSHTINAKAFYSAQQELIGLMEYLAKQLDIDITVSTIALKEGGIRSFLKVSKEYIQTHKSQIGEQIIVGIILAFLGIAGTPIKEIVQHYTQELLKSASTKEIEELRNKRDILLLKKEIEQLQKEGVKLDSPKVETTLRNKRARFYQEVSKAENLNKIEFGQKETPTSRDYIKREEVTRPQFSEYIDVSNELDPIEIKNAAIEVISPVLKKSKRKWKGTYNNKEISFSISDADFLQSVWERKISFTNGSVIHCVLTALQKVDNDGEVTVHGYEIIEVFNVSIGDIVHSLPKKQRMRKRIPDTEEQHLFPDNLFKEKDTNS